MASSSQMEKINLLSKSVALAGAAVFGLGLTWPMLATGASEWTPEQQAEFSSASRELHNSISQGHEGHEGHDHAHSDHKSPIEFDEAKARFQEISQLLDKAKEAPMVQAKRMKIAGGLLLGLGVAAMLFAKSSN